MADDPIKKAQETATIVENAFRGIADNVKQVFEAAIDGSDSFGKTLARDVTKHINSIARSSGKLVENEMKLADLSLKVEDIQRQKIINQGKILGIERQIEVAIREETISREQGNKQIQKAQEANQSITIQLDEQLNILKEINKYSDSYDNLAAGIKSIPGLGPILSKPFDNMAKSARQTASSIIISEEAAKKAAKEAPRIQLRDKKGRFTGKFTPESTFKPMSGIKKRAKIAGGAMKGLVKGGLGSMLGKAGWIGLLVKAIQKLVDALMMADKQSTAISRNLGASVAGAEGIRDAMADVARESNSTAVTLQHSLDTMFKMSSIMGVSLAINAKISEIEKERLEQLTDVNERLGLSEQSFSRLTKLSYMTGEGVDDILEGMIGVQSVVGFNNKQMFNSKEILEETLSLSDSIYLKFRFQTLELAKAVAETKLLGFSLSDIESTQSSLLNFQSSISAELNAELLTGRELNLERARYFALNDTGKNSMVNLGKELERQLGTLEEFNNMNFLQREALAKAFGMDEAKVIKILTKQEELRNIRNITNDEEFASDMKRLLFLGKADKLTKENLSTLLNSGKLNDEQNKKLEKAFGKSGLAMMKREDASKRFDRAIEQLQDAIVRLVGGGLLDKLVTVIENLALALTGDQSLFSIMRGGIDGAVVAREKQKQLEQERTKLLNTAEKTGKPIDADAVEDFQKQIRYQQKLETYEDRKEGWLNMIPAITAYMMSDSNWEDSKKSGMFQTSLLYEGVGLSDGGLGMEPIMERLSTDTRTVEALEKIASNVEKNNKHAEDNTNLLASINNKDSSTYLDSFKLTNAMDQLPQNLTI